VTKASLPSLWDMRKELKMEGDRSTRPTFRAFGLSNMGYGDGEKSDSTPTPVVNNAG